MGQFKDFETEFSEAYIEALLFASTDGDGDNLDKYYDSSDIAESEINRIQEQCHAFLTRPEVVKLAEDWGRDEYRSAGHDFFLTRNGHGAGFWDGDWGDDGDTLTAAAKSFGESEPYVGDDGEIYLFPPKMDDVQTVS